MDLSEREWVIGLHDYCGVPDPTRLFSKFNAIVTEELSRLGLELTYVGMEGDGYSGKATKANGAAYKRLLELGFSGINVLNLLSNPCDSNQPAYDRFFCASFGITPHNDNLLTFCVNDGIVAFGSADFSRILRGVANLHDWTTGYAFVDLVAKRPEFHVMGFDDGNLSSDELERLTKWYCSKRNDKVRRIRSIYPFTLLNSEQLEQRLANGQTVREFAESHEESSFITDGYRGLALWSVPEHEVNTLRKTFEGCGVVIA
ncbi:hypothetical protein OAS39_01945 [Pirellulales bacterium]|nr:hypothetical protein [Pirellulales bacterium]